MTAVSTAVIAVTGVWALWFAWSQLHQNHAEKQTQRLLELDRQYASEPLTKWRSTLAQGRSASKDEPEGLYEVRNFFETVRLLVRHGALDVNDVWSMFGYRILIVNADCREVVRDVQREDPTTYSNFVLLAEKMREIEKAEKGTSEYPSIADIKAYWQDEVASLAGGSSLVRGRKKKQDSTSK